MNVKKRALALGSVLVLFAATSNAQTWSEIWQDTIDLQKSSWSFGVKFGGSLSNDQGIGGKIFQKNVPPTTSEGDATTARIADYEMRWSGKGGVALEGRLHKYIGLNLDLLFARLLPLNPFGSDVRANNLGYGWGFTPSIVVQLLPLEHTMLRGLEGQVGLQSETPLWSWNDTRFKLVIGAGYALPQDSLFGGLKIELRKACLLGTRREEEKDSKGADRTWANGMTLSLSANIAKSLNWLNEDEE